MAETLPIEIAPIDRCCRQQAQCHWVKLDKSEIEDFGIDRLFLISRGKKLTIASFLSADEKADFARELGNALNEARRGPTRTVFDQPEIGWSGAPARPK
jgi:uncharacterized membrane protein